MAKKKVKFVLVAVGAVFTHFCLSHSLIKDKALQVQLNQMHVAFSLSEQRKETIGKTFGILYPLLLSLI